MGASGRTAGDQDRNDAALMIRLAEGSADTLTVLHDRYASLIFNLAAQTLDRAAAEEIVQDVFVAVWRKADTFDPARGTFRAWVLRIAHLRIVNELRRRSRRPRIEPDREGVRLAALAESRPGPQDAFWHDQRRDIVRAAVESLPPPQRQALRLAFLEDRSHEQVAAFLGLPLGTAKTRIGAGLQTLRVRLAPLFVTGLFVVGLITASLFRDQMLRWNLVRDEAALRLVTSSDVAPRRLVATPGTSAATHGNYRGRPGTAMAVTTFSQFPAVPAERVYCAWGLFGDRWYLLGTVHPDAQGRDIMISEGPHLSSPPTALKVTIEATDKPTAPIGTPVIAWPGP
jgi:RNA polymerase sigma factor (sigma-70 family)